MHLIRLVDILGRVDSLREVNVAFFRGTSLRPVPPGESKHKAVLYLAIHEDDLDEAQFVAWMKQADELPGERM
jgi:hypothetical protein